MLVVRKVFNKILLFFGETNRYSHIGYFSGNIEWVLGGSAGVLRRYDYGRPTVQQRIDKP